MSSLHHRLGFTGLSALLLTSLVPSCAPAPTEETESSTSELTYDGAFGDHVATTALRVNGRASGGRCLAEVQNSLEAAGVRHFPRLPGAVDLDNFMRNQGASLSAWRYEKQTRTIDDIPRGSIVAWRPGQCGYHSTYGHIEIAVGGGRACSDFCGTIKHGCGAPNVYVPVSGAGGTSGGTASGGTTGGAGMASACAVRPDGKLHCTNRVTPLRAQPTTSSATVDTLRSTSSWFTCWTNGQPHAGGNTTWYFTIGDDAGKQGFAPAVSLDTTSDFDANPSGAGLPHCP